MLNNEPYCEMLYHQRQKTIELPVTFNTDKGLI